jgi:hypothetical protein
MKNQEQAGMSAGYDRITHFKAISRLIAEVGDSPRPPEEQLLRLDAEQVRVLTDGLEWALAGEAVGDYFLRFLMSSRRGLTDLGEGQFMSEAECEAIRTQGITAGSLATIVAASTTPEAFAQLLDIADESTFWENRAGAMFASLDSEIKPDVPAETLPIQPAQVPPTGENHGGRVSSPEVGPVNGVDYDLYKQMYSDAVLRDLIEAYNSQEIKNQMSIRGIVDIVRDKHFPNHDTDPEQLFAFLECAAEQVRLRLGTLAKRSMDVKASLRVNALSTIVYNNAQLLSIEERYLDLKKSYPLKSQVIALRYYTDRTSAEISQLTGMLLAEINTILSGFEFAINAEQLHSALESLTTEKFT